MFTYVYIDTVNVGLPSGDVIWGVFVSALKKIDFVSKESRDF